MKMAPRDELGSEETRKRRNWHEEEALVWQVPAADRRPVAGLYDSKEAQ